MMVEKVKEMLWNKDMIEWNLWGMDNKGKNLAVLNEFSDMKSGAVFIGDSIVEGFPLSEMIGTPIYNRGVGGDSSALMLKRYPDIALPLRASKLFIWVGTNDIPFIPVEESLKNIGEVIRLTRAANPSAQIYLLSIAPVNESCTDGFVRLAVSLRTNEEIRRRNGAYRTFCDKNEIHYLDIYDDLLDEKGELSMSWTSDGLHPNARAYVRIVKKLKEVL